jgi:hypothetical protein
MALNLRHYGADFGGADIDADDGAMCHSVPSWIADSRLGRG